MRSMSIHTRRLKLAMKVHRSRATVFVIGAVVLAAAGGSAAIAAESDSGNTAPPSAAVTTSSLPSSLLAAYPVIQTTQTTSEAGQAPTVEAALQEDYAKPTGLGEPGPASEVDAALARRYYSGGSKADFVVPGTKGTVCIVELDAGAGAGGGCTTTESFVANGMVGYTQLSGESMEIAGVLPKGSSAVTVVTTSGAETVALNVAVHGVS